MRHPIYLFALFCLGCGARTGHDYGAPPASDSDDGGAAGATRPTDPPPTPRPTPTGTGTETPPDPPIPVCPANSPKDGRACDGEGLECGYGPEVCPHVCICERGSWLCTEDNCAVQCPARLPEQQKCDKREVGLVCSYPRGCPWTCTCRELPGKEPAWACITPPC